MLVWEYRPALDRIERALLAADRIGGDEVRELIDGDDIV